MSHFTTLAAKPNHTLITLRRIRDDKARRIADYLLDGPEHEGVLSELVIAYDEARRDYVTCERSLSEATLARTGGGIDGA